MNHVMQHSPNPVPFGHTEAIVGLADAERLDLLVNTKSNVKQYMLIIDFADDGKTYEALRRSAADLMVVLNDMDRFREFYEDFEKVLRTHTTPGDAEELVRTLEAYTQNAGDFEESSKALHLHVNTVRYRINKIRRYLDLEEDIVLFHEKISILMKVKRILDQDAANK